jgi:hypothetical protein
VCVALVALLALTFVTAEGAAAATFTAHGSVEQVHATGLGGAEPNVDL